MAQTLKELAGAHSKAVGIYNQTVEAERRAGLQRSGALRLTNEHVVARKVLAQSEFQVRDAREQADKALRSLLSHYNSLVNRHLSVGAGPYLVSVKVVTRDELDKRPFLDVSSSESNEKGEHELAGAAIAANCETLLAMLPEGQPVPVPTHQILDVAV